MASKYLSADLGCWEAGKNVLLKSRSLDGALKEAQKYLDDHRQEVLDCCDGKTKSPEIVQIRKHEGKKVQPIWDWINGDLRR